MRVARVKGVAQIARRHKRVTDFVERNIIITEGTHEGELMQLKNSPWMIKPLVKLHDDRVQSVTVYKAAGCGGTYIGEGWYSYTACRSPGNHGYQCKTEAKSKEFSDRAYTKLGRCQAYQDRKTTERHADSKMRKKFNWPNGFIKVQAANPTNSDSDRLKYVTNDEAYAFRAGRMAAFEKRTVGTFPFFKFLNISTAATAEGDDIDEKFKEGCQDEYHLCCPKCSGLFLPCLGEWSLKLYQTYVIQWAKKGTEKQVAESVRMVCPHCEARFSDTPVNRRRLLEGSDYVAFNEEAPDDVYSCRFNAWIPWFVPWKNNLREYLFAQQMVRMGDLSKMMDYTIKREARTWENKSTEESPIKVTGDYELAPLETARGTLWVAPEWEHEDHRFGLVDVQHKHLWMTAFQANGNGGGCRLLWAGKAANWEEADAIRADLGIQPHEMAGDCGTWGLTVQKVYENCGVRGWYGMEGDKKDHGFPWKWTEEDEDTGEVYERNEMRSYSDFQTRDAGIGTREEGKVMCTVIQFSNRRIKDQLWEMLRGNGAYFGIPSNLDKLEGEDWLPGERVLKQWDSERLKDKRNAKTLAMERFWGPRTASSQNHLWDCACMGLVMMHANGCFG